MNKLLYDTEYLQLKSAEWDNGKNWVYAHRPNADNVVVILPIYKDEILFLTEKRPPLIAEGRSKYCVGLPAGLVGDERKEESIEEAIRAELLEEAGLTADRIEIKCNRAASSSGCVSETCVIAIAYIINRDIVSTPVDDGGVIVDRIWVKKENVLEWLNKKDKDGFAISSSTLGALFYLYAEGST